MNASAAFRGRHAIARTVLALAAAIACTGALTGVASPPQRSFQAGLRFSLNARGPSAPSSLSAIS